MKKHVGSNFIISSDDKGLIIKKNEQDSDCGELFTWKELKPILNQSGKNKLCPDCGHQMKKMVMWQCNNERCWENE